jgi:hypothetical protein
VGKFPSTPYFDNLIDDFGIWQHTDEKSILNEEGYALDDAARGLLLTLALNRQNQSEVLFSYILKSQSKDGFYGFARQERDFIPMLASDDATGQVMWAAGYALSKKFQSDQAKELIANTVGYIDRMGNMRGYAYALLGSVYVSKQMAQRYYKKLRNFFDDTDNDWPWPESALTYGNGIAPYAFLRYGLIYGDRQAVLLGRRLLKFVEEKCTHNRQRGPIGNEGWLPRDARVVPTYSQQPIDTAYMVWAWMTAYQISGDNQDLSLAEAWMKWFEGDNVAHEKMYNPDDMRCFDGIDPGGVHHNSGAESNICFLLSKYVISKKVTV